MAELAFLAEREVRLKAERLLAEKDELIARNDMNSQNAFVITIAYLIAATGPLSVGALRDLTGDFRASLWLLAGVGLIMLALTPFLQPHRPKPAA